MPEVTTIPKPRSGIHTSEPVWVVNNPGHHWTKTEKKIRTENQKIWDQLGPSGTRIRIHNNHE